MVFVMLGPNFLKSIFEIIFVVWYFAFCPLWDQHFLLALPDCCYLLHALAVKRAGG